MTVPTHAVRQLAADLGVVKMRSEGRRASTLAQRTRRTVKRIEKQLKEKPLEAVRKGIEAETSKEQEIVRRGYDFFLNLVPDAEYPPAEPVPMETLLGLGKFLSWVGNRLDRHRDQIVELMERGKSTPSLTEYLAAKAPTLAAAVATDPPAAELEAEDREGPQP